MSDSDTENADGVYSTAAFETMVIRAWIEPGHENRFRARLTSGGESGNTESTMVSNNPKDVIDAVWDWLAKVQEIENGSQASPLSDESEQ